MKKLLATILAFISITACAFGLTACDLFGPSDNPSGDNTKTHTHDYVFKHDDTQHWKECRNSGCDQKTKDRVDHDFTSGDCICGAEKPVPPHTHNVTKVEAVPVDCTVNGSKEYWLCSECNGKFTDDTATTKITDISIPAPGHTYDTVWSKDATNHWYAATCAHTSEKKDITPHDFSTGDCVCGEPHPHVPVNTPLVPATCGTDGNIDYYTCSTCSKIFSDANCTNEIQASDTIIPATGNHTTPTPLLKTEAVDKTCTTNGHIEYYTCTVCSKIFSDAAATTEITPADTIVYASHETTKTDAVPENCGDDGNIEYWTCSVCDKTFSDEEGTSEITDTVIPATGNHTLVKTEEKAKTCTDDGNIEYWECSVCHKVFADENAIDEILDKNDTVVPASHELTKEEATAETCGTDGNYAYWTCDPDTGCGKIFQDEGATTEFATLDDTVIPATGNHLNLTEVPANAPTCGEDGNKQYWDCDVCHKKFSAATVTTSPSNEVTEEWTVVDATGNHPDATFTFTAYLAKTCTTDGNYAYWTCGVCNKNYKPDSANATSTTATDHLPATKDRELTDVVIKAGHELQHIDGVEMTCFENGEMERYTCTVCHENFRDAEATDKIEGEVTIVTKGHTVDTDNWSVDENKHWHEPSCGIAEHREDEEEHVYGLARSVSKVCEVCKYAPGLKFQLNADGTGYIFIGFDYTVYVEVETIVIPIVYGGKPVVGIGNSALANKTTITGVVIPQSVTTIGVSAFNGCTGLIEIVIPDSVVTIGNSAFNGCINLTTVDIKGGVKTIGSNVFRDCVKLVTVILPDTVITLGGYVFYNCKELTNIVLPENLTTIGANAFNGCIALIEIILPDSVITLEDGAFSGCTGLTKVVLSNSLQKINKNTFYGCIVLEVIIIPVSVTNIGDSAFEGCKGLINIILPENLAWLGNGAFRGCTGLIEIIIPGGVQTIGKYSFYGCIGLIKLIIQDGVQSIGDNAFENCTGLKDIKIPETVLYIKGGAFRGCIRIIILIIPGSVKTIYEGAFAGCTGITKVEIKEGSGTSVQQELREGAFSGCTGIIELIIPKTVVRIGKLVFSGCTGLPRVTLPEGLKDVGDSAFSGCVNLIYILLPNTLTTLGSTVFQNCAKLEQITIPRNVTKIGANVFLKCIRIIIYCIIPQVPADWDASWAGGSPSVLDSENNDVADDGFIHTVVDDIRYLLIDTTKAKYLPWIGPATPEPYPNPVPSTAGRWAIVDKQSTTISGDISIKGSVTYNDKEYILSGIAEDGFKDCKEITSVTFEGAHTSLTINVKRVFSGCTKLRIIYVPVYDENGKQQMKPIEIKEGML